MIDRGVSYFTKSVLKNLVFRSMLDTWELGLMGKNGNNNGLCYSYNYSQCKKLTGGGYSTQALGVDKITLSGRRPDRTLKRVILLSLLLLSLLSSLSASSLLWSWPNTDEGVKYYRYQKEGEDEWTVVDGSITSVTTDENVKRLYLQASYDGVNWSESSIGTYSREKETETKSNDDIGFVTLTWDNESAYNYFRYRRDVNDKDDWTETNGDTTSVILPYHKGLNTYYIESSWDGTLWSESSSCIYIRGEEKEKTKCSCAFLTWTWDNSDEKVLSFRYQLNGKDKEGWTYVERSVDKVELPAEDGINTLYVESTYDGEVWSETAEGTYYYTSQPYKARKNEITLKIMPYTLQRITYRNDHSPLSRLSGYSNGLGISYSYNFSSLFALVGDISSEYYSFSSFHTYRDFKAVVKTRFSLIESKDYRNKVYLSFGAGVDTVIRDDSKLGVYPLFVFGVGDSFMLSESFSLALSCDIASSFQDGTSVLHVIPSLSFSYHWGCKAGCTGCKGGCR